MSVKKKLQSAEAILGELLERHDDASDLDAFTRYSGPVEFNVEELGEDPWQAQRDVLEKLADPSVDRLAWRSAQGIGKSRAIAQAALWWTYVRGGQVRISAPTARTIREVIMRKELARIFYRNPQLPGELYTDSLRVRGEEPSILAFTATSASGATGHHDSEGGILFILDEAQGVGPEAWEAMDANTTGERDKQFVCGNPLKPSGPFFEVSQPGSGWEVVQTSAFDHPNLDPDADRKIPGGPSEAWLERMRDRWGEGSGMWQARVEGEFSEGSDDGLFRRSWLDAAAERWEKGIGGGEEPVVAVDVARFGDDSTVLAFRRGDRVERFVSWEKLDTAETTERVKRELAEAGVLPADRGGGFKGTGTVVVDAIGLGAGVLDRLKAEDYRTVEYKGSKSPREKDRYRNLRAESYWRLKDALEAGELSIPPDEGLFQELLAVRWAPTADGRIQLESKTDLKARLGKSPDRADALAMCWYPKARGQRGKVRVVHY